MKLHNSIPSISLLFMLLSGLLFVSSCENNENVYQKMARLQTEEMESGILIDTIFLGFRFGMTAEEFEIECNRLSQVGKIAKSGNEYHYSLHGSSLIQNYECTIAPEYFDGKLYKLTLSTPKVSVPMDAVVTFIKMVLEKYHITSQVTNEEMEQYSNCPAYYLYKGNLHIAIHCNEYQQAVMSYTDGRVLKKIDELKKSEEKKAVQDF